MMNEQQLQTEINQSKRNRRKTAYEEFLDEEPYFTDTEDELEFEENLTKHIASTSNIFTYKENQTTYLKKLQGELAFSDNCTNCKKNREFLFNLASVVTEQNCVCPPTTDSGINSATGSTNADEPRENNEIELFSEQSVLRDRNSFDNSPVSEKASRRKQSTRTKKSKDVSSKTLDNQDKEYEIENEPDQPKYLNMLLQEIEEKRLKLACFSPKTNDIRNSFPMPQQQNKLAKRKRTISTNSRRSSRSDFRFIDKKMFKVPVDTTSNGDIEKALLRKLGRSAGGSMLSESICKEHGAFRSFQTTHRVRKLYTPDEWINSKEFSLMKASQDIAYINLNLEHFK